MKKYLIALPAFRHSKGFNHPTILVRAKNETEARTIALHVSVSIFLGDIKEVFY